MSDVTLGWIAVAILAGSILLWIRAIRRVAIPENRAGFVLAWLAAAGLGITALLGSPGWIGGIPAGLAVLGGTFLLFTIAISAQKLDADAIAVGDTLPAFTATDEHGQLFDSASLAGHPTLIKFFRGHW